MDAFVGGTFGTDPTGVTVTGGSWVEGAPTTAADVTLPDGVSPAQVQGLRFTFTRADGAIWENPATPTQSVPLQVERRAALRTGGPVLSDMAGNAPAPGETAAGVASNSVQGVVEGADRVGDLPITATDDADASIVYQHLSNAVQVVKKANGAEAGGSQAPGVSFPYTLEVTNTGQVPIVDLVVTDHLPSDADGQLVFDPDVHLVAARVRLRARGCRPRPAERAGHADRPVRGLGRGAGRRRAAPLHVPRARSSRSARPIRSPWRSCSVRGWPAGQWCQHGRRHG